MIALVFAFVVGFVALSYELVWYRAYSFASWSSPGTFGLLLGFYLVGIVAGALYCQRLARRYPDGASPRFVERLLAFFAVANLLSWAVVPALARAVGSFHWAATLPLVALATSASGAILPLLCHFAIAPGDDSGERVARVYAANILGSALGSLVTGFVLFEWLPLGRLTLLLTVAATLTTLSFSRLWLGRLPRPLAAIALGAIAIPLATQPLAFDRLWERLLYKQRLTAAHRFTYTLENRHGVINETQDRKVYGGGVYDGGFNLTLQNDFNGVLRAYAVAGLHPTPKRVLMIGLATGSWARAIAALPGVEQLTVIEINPGYRELIARHPEVAPLLHDPRVQLVVDDGRRWLRRHDDRFDVIVMNTTWHFRSLVSQLLSTEFLQLARAHLNRGGVLFYNTTGSPDAQRTAAVAFPHALLFHNMAAVSDQPLAFDRERFLATVGALEIDGARVLDPAAPWGTALAHELATQPPLTREAVLAATTDATIITDDNMACEWNPVAHREVTQAGFFDD